MRDENRQKSPSMREEFGEKRPSMREISSWNSWLRGGRSDFNSTGNDRKRIGYKL